MPDEKKSDPFKPTQPSIPGVAAGASNIAPAQPPSSRASAPREGSAQPLAWITIAVVVVFITGGALFFWLHGTSPKASAATTSAEAAVKSSAASDAAKLSKKILVGPGPVATTEELAKVWSAKRFLFPDPITSERVPAMVVHLPDGSYWAFSLREPFGTCELEFVSDIEKLSSDYSYRGDHPMVANPCSRTLYDLLLYGSSSNGGLVRGEIVQGSGIRPPMAIEVRVNGKQIEAVRME